jgi:4-amino-4-deoxy-L-arabinose transferase-like glycosyltransferase
MRFAAPALAIVCGFVFFTGLGGVGYLDWREARDVQVAREMLNGREVLTPLLGRAPHFEKPAPAYAPEALVQLFASDFLERSADPASNSTIPSRAVRAAFAVVLLLVTGSIGARLFGARAGVFSAMVLSTTLVLPLAAKVDGTQLLGTALAWVGAAGLADTAFGRRAGRDLRLVVVYGAMAGALMVAGPLSALWPLLGLWLYHRLARSPEGWRQARAGAGLVVLVGVALPWYGAMAERHGAAFLSHAPFFPYAAETRAAWWTGLVLTPSFVVVGFFPWSALLPAALSHAASWWRRALRRSVLRRRADDSGASQDPIEREVREEGAAHFFIACLFAALAPVLFYPAPPLTAALPAMPAAALLCGRFLDHLFEDPERLRRPLRHATLMLALVGSVGAVLLTVVGPRIREATPEFRLLGTVVFITSWLPFLADFMGRRRTAALALALPVTLGAPAVSMNLLPAMEDWLNTRAVAEALDHAAPERATLVLTEPPRPSLRVFTPRNLVVESDVHGAVERFRAVDGLTYVGFRPATETRVTRETTGPLEIVLRTPTLVLARVHPD